MRRPKWLAVMMISALLFALVPAMAVAETLESTTYNLYAGQSNLVGTVIVSHDATNLYVKYQLKDVAIEAGWLITETHVHVGKALSDFPLTARQNNPIPGQFDFNKYHDPGVTEYTEAIPIGDWSGELIVAAHAVVARNISPCAGEYAVYGIERNTGKVIDVNVVTGETAEVFTTVTPPKTNVGPNGLAYDPENNLFYYASYTGTASLYVWDGITEKNLGQLTGAIAAADFYAGKYYYIASGTDDLYEVSFDALGEVDSVNKVGDISGNQHAYTFNGDIGISPDGVIYGWGMTATRYHFFSVNRDGTGFQLIRDISTSGNFSLQLAFGSDGVLYGHDARTTAPGGGMYEVNLTDGMITQLFTTTERFTDMASGGYCEPILEIETAWAATGVGENRFSKGNWGTWISYSITSP